MYWTGRDRRFLVYRVSAPEILHTAGLHRPELPAPLYFPCEYSAHITGLNKLTDLLIFEVEQLPAFVDGAALLQAARRAVHLVLNVDDEGKHYRNRKRLVRTVLIFTESSDQLSRATDRVPGLPASPGYAQ